METVRATWSQIDLVIHARGGRQVAREGSVRLYHVPMPVGGFLEVDIKVRPTYCGLGIDRICTTDRDSKKAAPWFKENVQPLVDQAKAKRSCWGWSSDPSGLDPFYSNASPIERQHLVNVLTSWLDLDMTSWSLSYSSNSDTQQVLKGAS